jgi:DNA polymerase III delta subunit
MALPKVWWLDDTDPISAKKKLAAVRQQLADWDWTRFVEDKYEASKDAYLCLSEWLSTPSMLAPGKAVYFYGVPFKKSDYSNKLANDFDHIHPSVILIIIAKPDKVSPLYKKVQSMVTSKTGRADEAFEFDRKPETITWIKDRGQDLGVKIDDEAASMLADFSGFDPAMICMELQKLKHMTTDGQITAKIVEAGAFVNTASDVKKLTDMIVADDCEMAHEFLQRLLDRGEDPLKICGFLQDWSTKTALAESCGCDYNSIKVKVAQCLKYDKDTKKPVPMFAKPGAVYHSCTAYAGAKKSRFWAFKGLELMGKLQISIRTGEDGTRAMHEYVKALTKDQRDG